MIKQINKWTKNCWELPFYTFQTLNKETNLIIDEYGDPYPIENTSYYPIMEYNLTYDMQRNMIYQRCVNLNFVDSCVTDTGDDLTKYGFKQAGIINTGWIWNR